MTWESRLIRHDSTDWLNSKRTSRYSPWTRSRIVLQVKCGGAGVLTCFEGGALAIPCMWAGAARRVHRRRARVSYSAVVCCRSRCTDFSSVPAWFESSAAASSSPATEVLVSWADLLTLEMLSETSLLAEAAC